MLKQFLETLTFLAVTAFLVVASGPAAHSQKQRPIQGSSPRKQLAEYVADLQKNPSDDVLREKLIKLALTLQPMPAAPPEADELAGRAKYSFEHATSKADFVLAAEAFGKASLLAPWVSEYYLKQGILLEKAERYDDAIKNLQWYLIAAPDARNAKEVRERIGGLKYANEKAISEAAAKAKLIAEQKQAESEREARLGVARQKAEYLRQQFARLRLQTSYLCIPTNRIRPGVSAQGCTDAEAQGTNWVEWRVGTGAGTHPEVKLAGPEQDTLQIFQSGAPSGYLCIKAADYSIGQTDFKDWRKWNCGGDAALPVTRVILNSEWNGSPAIYIETCQVGSADNCSEKSRVYIVYSR
jgi:hypothetical protein